MSTDLTFITNEQGQNLLERFRVLIEANPLKILASLRTYIPPEFFKETIAESASKTSGAREVILSEYFIGK